MEVAFTFKPLYIKWRKTSHPSIRLNIKSDGKQANTMLNFNISNGG